VGISYLKNYKYFRKNSESKKIEKKQNQKSTKKVGKNRKKLLTRRKLCGMVWRETTQNPNRIDQRYEHRFHRPRPQD
jgi:hypothetical protein